MNSNQQIVVAKSEYWIRVNLALEFCVKDTLRTILHNLDNDNNYQGLPQYPRQLYQQMLICKQDNKNKLHKVLKQDQWDTLCPQNQQTDSNDWDITLLAAVIRSETNLTKPLGGWAKVQANDQSKAAFVHRARELRNEIKHGSVTDIKTVGQFSAYWNRVEKILLGLKYQDIALFHDLEKGSLDKHNAKVVTVVNKFKQELNCLSNQATDNTNEIQALKLKIQVLETKQCSDYQQCEDSIQKLKEDFKDLTTQQTLIEKKLAQRTESEGAQSKPKEALHWDIRKPVSNFFGRQQVMEDINDKLDASKCVAISALGGVGKTQTAAKFVELNKTKFKNIFWITAANIKKTLSEIIYKLDKEDISQNVSLVLICQILSSKLPVDENTLFIFDDVVREHLKNLNIFITNILSSKVRILLTTQLNDFGNPDINVFKLSMFKGDEAKLFLRNNLQDITADEVDLLVEELKAFPMVLQQAVSYIQKHKTIISTYISKFRQSNSSLVDPNKTLSEYDKTLLTVWKIAFENMKSSPKALTVLAMMAFMDNSCIKKETFQYFKEIEDEIELNEIVETICSYSLVQESEEKLHIHDLVQRVVRLSLETEVFGTTQTHIISKLAELLNSIAISFKSDAFHTDEKYLWFIHTVKIMQIESTFMAWKCFNWKLIYNTAISRYETNILLKLTRFVYDHKIDHYRKTKNYKDFTGAVFFKIIDIRLVLNEMKLPNLDEILRFEKEFKRELKKCNEEIFSYKIAAARAFNRSKQLVTGEARISIVYDTIKKSSGMDKSKLDLVPLLSAERRETILKTISTHNFNCNVMIKWYRTTINESTRKKRNVESNRLLSEYDSFMLRNKVPSNHIYRQDFKFIQSMVLFRQERFQECVEVLDTIPKHLSNERVDFVTVKVLLLTRLNKLDEARSMLPSDEECLFDLNYSMMLAYIKFMKNEFDSVPELLRSNEEDEEEIDRLLSLWIHIYTIAFRQFQERKNELASNDNRLQIIAIQMEQFKKVIMERFFGGFNF